MQGRSSAVFAIRRIEHFALNSMSSNSFSSVLILVHVAEKNTKILVSVHDVSTKNERTRAEKFRVAFLKSQAIHD